MKVFSVQETTRGIYGVATVINRGTFLKYEEAKKLFRKLVDLAMAQDSLYSQAVNNRGYATFGLTSASWGTGDGRFHQFNLIESTIGITTTFDELSKQKTPSAKSPFEKRLDKQVNSVWTRRPTDETEATANMLYNSGEFIIVFQCNDLSRTVATSVPFGASAYNNITTAINNIIKEEY